MRLAEQWSEIQATLPRGWQRARLALALEDERQAERTALILGPAAPGRVGATFRLDVERGGTNVTPGPGLVRRIVVKLDSDGIRGRLEVVEAADAAAASEDVRPEPGLLAGQWQRLVDELPSDWSHLYAQVDLDSSDFLERGALLLSPVNPLRAGGARSLRFRCARVVGYGVAAEMARRCLERLDSERITGSVRIVQVVSEARPVATQGPVWRIEGRSV